MTEIGPGIRARAFLYVRAATVPNMIDEAAYQDFTGAEAPANFAFLRDVVVDRLELALGRKIVSAARTETLRAYRDGIVYPSATPVTACSYEHTDTAVRVGTSGVVSLSYTGGFTAYGESGVSPLPAPLAAAIAWGIHTTANPNASALPSGVQSINIAGEYAITREAGSAWGADGQPLPKWAAAIADLGGRCATLAAPFRRVP